MIMKYDDEYYKAELKYYRNNRSELIKKYRGQLIAISREGVICHGWNISELMERIERLSFSHRRFIIKCCGYNKSVEEDANEGELGGASLDFGL